MRMSPDGKKLEDYASGIRNPVGLAIHPQSWAVDRRKTPTKNPAAAGLVVCTGQVQPMCRPPLTEKSAPVA